MKKIGIVGGLGPESSLDYYRGIIDAFKSTYDSMGYPEIGIESLDLKAFLDLVQQDAWDAIADQIAARFESLRKSGAVIGAIASNTPHKVFPQIQERTSLPLVIRAEDIEIHYLDTTALHVAKIVEQCRR